MTHHDDIVDNLLQELRRGSLVLLVLSQMHKSQYGYSLLQDLAEKGITVEAGTLYPLMRRLEKQGLLGSEWYVEAGRPRKYYTLSADGERALEKMKQEWHQLVSQMNKVLEES